MSANTSRRGIGCSLSYARIDPQAGTAEECLDGATEYLERGREHRRPNHKDKIVSGRDLVIDQPDSFAGTAFGAIAVMSFAKLLAHDKSTPCATCSVSARVEDQERMRPRFSLTAHAPKLIGTSKPLITAH